MSEKMIPVESILDPEWNSRLYTDSKEEQKELEDLAASILAEGQLQAGIVEGPTDGKYMLVIGSRRLRAIKLAGIPEFRADVWPPTDESTRVIRNITENVKRKDLSQFEQARACVKLAELGVKGDEIGRRLGFSKQKVSNLAISYRELQATPRVLDAWRTEHPAATVDFLRELAGTKAKSAEKRIEKIEEAWDTRVKLLEKADAIVDPPAPATRGGKATNGESGGGIAPPPYKVPFDRYKELVAAVRKSKIAGGKMVIDCLDFAVGKTDKVKGIIESTAE